MSVNRALTTAVGAALAVLCLGGCQEKLVAGVTFSANGSVTVTEVSSVSYDVSAGPLTVVKPDPAKLLAAAKKGTRAFVGPGVDKPVVKLVRLSKHTLQLSVSQTMGSLALLNKHGDAFDAAALSLDVTPAKGAVSTPEDPLGLKGPRTEKVTIEPGDSSDAGTGSDTFHVTHVGHTWTFVLAENPKEFAQDRKSSASWATTAKKLGLPPKAFVAEIHVKLPGKVVATNGKRLAGGVVSWDLLHLASPKLTVSTKD
jgi:hypothetical protein